MTDNSELRHADMRSWSLSQWLEYLESIHSKDIDMGLSRVKDVFSRLNCDFSKTRVITVAGTNGKGTTCAMLEQLCLTDDLSVVVYGSPHIVTYRERVRCNGQLLSAERHCEAFLAVEKARGDTSLTYFEFGTLAALWLAAHADCDITLLEVGLGGRLDAVNVVDPDIAVITSIGLDHQDWLGDTREAIGAEKAGILRNGIPVVVGDPEPPETVVEAVESHQAKGYFQGKDFSFESGVSDFRWRGANNEISQLPVPYIPPQNVSTALQVASLLQLSLDKKQIGQAISRTRLPGRAQVISKSPMVLLDVAHNPQATEYLADVIARYEYDRLHFVVSMLADKDIENALQPLMRLPANWYIGKLDVPRAAKIEQIKTVLVGQQMVLDFVSVWDAFQKAKQQAGEQDLIVVFGSFYTVAEILEQNERLKGEE